MDLEYVLNTLKSKNNEFLEKLKISLDEEDKKTFDEAIKKYELMDFKKLPDSFVNFMNILENDDMFILFSRSKIKVFSSKTEETHQLSLSLYGGELNLKYILNKRSEAEKKNIWNYLHLFYFLLLQTKDKYFEDRKSYMIQLLKNTENEIKKEDIDRVSSKVKKELLDVDVNDTTNNMIDDIVSSFQESLDGGSGNPFDSIMDITSKITEKYKNKIESGEVELDKMMGSITKGIPGMDSLVGGLGGNKKPEEKVVIDENFSTDNVELGKENEKKGFNLSGMMKVMNGMNGKDGGPNLKGLLDVMGKLNTVENEEDAQKLKGEMDNYLEKELGVDVSKLNKTIESIETDNKVTDIVENVNYAVEDVE